MDRAPALPDLASIERQLRKNRSLSATGRVAARAQRAFLDGGGRSAFDAWASALQWRGSLERLELLLREPLDLPEAGLGLWRIRSAYGRCDYVEALRRAEAYFGRFGVSDESAPVLQEIAALCEAGCFSRQDLLALTGGGALAALMPELPATRRFWTTPDPGWPDKLAAEQARGAKRRRLARLFLARYDWQNRDVALAWRFWQMLPGQGLNLHLHLLMAPYLNGEPSLAAFEAYVAVLYAQLRSPDIAFLLAEGPPSWRLALHRALAQGELGDKGPDVLPPGPPAGAAEQDCARLMQMRAQARDAHPPRPRPVRAHRARRFALCVSGQLRAWSLALPPLVQALRREGEADVFVSTWNRAGTYSRRFHRKQFSPVVAEFMRGLPDPFEDAFFSLLPQLREDPDELQRALRETLGTEHVEMEDEAEFEREAPKLLPGYEAASLNQYKMYYKMHAAWRMQHLHAKRAGIRYDFVLRVRPDYLIHKLPFGEVYERVDDDAVVAGSYGYFESFDDRFAIGSPSAMARHAAAWPRILKAGTHRCLPLVGDVLAEDLMMANLIAEGCQPIVLRDIKTFGQRQVQVPVTDEAIAGMLEDCARKAGLNRGQLALADVLTRSEEADVAGRARSLLTQVGGTGMARAG